MIEGPIGPYHSALAFFAYRAGLAADAALKLFNRDVFDTVGYFDVWNGATEALLKDGQRFGLDFREDVLRWTRRGCFMYSSIHPKPFVFFDFARQLMDKAGVPMKPVNFDDYAVDDLVRGAVYPVYPDIAEFYGIRGSYVFKGPEHAPGGLDIGDFWDLPGFVRESYRFYVRHDAKELTNERVQGWLDNPEISGFLKDVAASGSNHAPAPKRQQETLRSAAGNLAVRELGST
jgi:hypothetical protein